MSQEENGGIVRTVTAPYRSRSSGEMNIIGLLYVAGLAVALLPLLPFLAIVWLFSRLSG